MDSKLKIAGGLALIAGAGYGIYWLASGHKATATKGLGSIPAFGRAGGTGYNDRILSRYFNRISEQQREQQRLQAMKYVRAY